MIVRLTQSGSNVLRKLSLAHHEELEKAGPVLAQAIGDFTADSRMVPIATLAIVIGLLSTGVAWALLRLGRS